MEFLRDVYFAKYAVLVIPYLHLFFLSVQQNEYFKLQVPKLSASSSFLKAVYSSFLKIKRTKFIFSRILL